jgi:serine/threonine protein kinase
MIGERLLHHEIVERAGEGGMGVHDIASGTGRDFIFMEYVDGKVLTGLIFRHGMRLNDAPKYADRIAGALARAHSAGILNRHLKPANIMVDDHGLVRILDCGLAQLTDAVSGAELLRPKEGRFRA